MQSMQLLYNLQRKGARVPIVKSKNLKQIQFGDTNTGFPVTY